MSAPLQALETFPSRTERATNTTGTTTGQSREAAQPDPSTPSGDVDLLTREARLSQRLAEFVDTGWSVQRYVLRRPGRVLQMLRDIRALPKADATLPDTTEAAAVKALMMRHANSRRATSGVSAVLTLPTVPGTYLDGSSRATVRRKSRAATKRGVSVRPVPTADRRKLLELADQHELTNERGEYRVDAPDNADLLQYDLWLAAYDAEGEPIALSVTPVAGRWSALRYFRTLRNDPAASEARYLLMGAVAEELGARQVQYLVDTARPHWLPNGVRHYQRMVGFRLIRVGRARIVP